MKSHEFITEAGIDDLEAQSRAEADPANKPKLPYNQSRAGNFLGKVASAPINAISSVAGGLNKALQTGANMGLSGVDVEYNDPTKKQQQQQQTQVQPDQPNQGNDLKFVPNQVDPKVSKYLKQAAGGNPLQQNTGNDQIDKILKNAGLLK